MASHESVAPESETEGPSPAVTGQAARTFSYRHTDRLPNLIGPENCAVVNPWAFLEGE